MRERYRSEGYNAIVTLCLNGGNDCVTIWSMENGANELPQGVESLTREEVRLRFHAALRKLGRFKIKPDDYSEHHHIYATTNRGSKQVVIPIPTYLRSSPAFGFIVFQFNGSTKEAFKFAAEIEQELRDIADQTPEGAQFKAECGLRQCPECQRKIPHQVYKGNYPGWGNACGDCRDKMKAEAARRKEERRLRVIAGQQVRYSIPAQRTSFSDEAQPRMPDSGAVNTKLRFQILARDGFTCQYCGRRAPEVILHVDHVLPVSRGGLTIESNLKTSCQDCNLGKSAMLLPE